jgi:mannitol-1-/sugar-/sorbitol-6-phosphatase
MTPSPAVLTCDAVLFDLDGVLIDSTTCIVRHWEHWAKLHGLDLATIMQHAHGVRTVETMRLVAPHLKVEAEAEQFTAQEVADTDGVVAIEGAAALLADLPADAWGIVTSGSTALARARLARAGLPIPRVLITADQVSRGKPSPEPYLAGAARLGLPVERCVVIEDAPAGIASGVAAGMRVVGIGSTHGREELLALGATVVVPALTALEITTASPGDRLHIHISP